MNKICFICKQETLSSKCCNKRTYNKCNIEGCNMNYYIGDPCR